MKRPATWADVSDDGRSVAVTVVQPAPAVLIHDVLDNRSRSGEKKWIAAMTTSSADHLVLVDVEQGAARTVRLQRGGQCEFTWEFIRLGPEWPYAAMTSEVDAWIVNVETGEPRHLAASTYGIAAWRGSHIHFSRRGGQTDWPGYTLFRVPSAGGHEERLFNAPVDCGELRLGRDGRTVVCAVDESRLDVRLVDGLGGDEALVFRVGTAMAAKNEAAHSTAPTWCAALTSLSACARSEVHADRRDGKVQQGEVGGHPVVVGECTVEPAEAIDDVVHRHDRRRRGPCLAGGHRCVEMAESPANARRPQTIS